MKLVIDIASVLSAIPAAIKAYASLKGLLNNAKADLEEPGADWCTLINTMHGFKVSWASQRWSFSEWGNPAPNQYTPVYLKSIISAYENIPSPYRAGEDLSVVPAITIHVDLNGSVPMERYVKTTIDNKMRYYRGGRFTEELTAKVVEKESARFAGRVSYPGSEDYPARTLMDVTQVSRSGTKMISVIGSIIENCHNFDIVFDDMIKVVKTVALLRR